MADSKSLNVIGIKIESKEHYDRLMEKHSNWGGLFGIDFKACFDGYPEGYPCLVEYYVGDMNPFSFNYSTQLSRILDDGYLIQFYKQKEGA